MSVVWNCQLTTYIVSDNLYKSTHSFTIIMMCSFRIHDSNNNLDLVVIDRIIYISGDIAGGIGKLGERHSFCMRIIIRSSTRQRKYTETAENGNFQTWKQYWYCKYYFQCCQFDVQIVIHVDRVNHYQNDNFHNTIL